MSLPVRCMPCLALLPCQAGPQLRPVFDRPPSQSGTFRNPNVSLSALEHHISFRVAYKQKARTVLRQPPPGRSDNTGNTPVPSSSAGPAATPARPEHQDTSANADIGWMEPDLKETNEKRSSHARPPSQADLQRPRVTSCITETCRGLKFESLESSEESPAVPPPTPPKGTGRPHELLVVAAAASSSLKKKPTDAGN